MSQLYRSLPSSLASRVELTIAIQNQHMSGGNWLRQTLLYCIVAETTAGSTGRVHPSKHSKHHCLGLDTLPWEPTDVFKLY